MEQLKRHNIPNSNSSNRSMDEKFVPQLLGEQNLNVCDAHQALVVACMAKADKSGGNCNDAFSKWNTCIAKDCGFIHR